MTTEKPLCFICGEVQRAWGDLDGLHFHDRGNYGSSIHDTLMTKKHFEIVICDKCLKVNKERSRLVPIPKNMEITTDWREIETVCGPNEYSTMLDISWCCDDMKKAWGYNFIGINDHDDDHRFSMLQVPTTNYEINIYRPRWQYEEYVWENMSIQYCPFCGGGIIQKCKFKRKNR